MSTVSVGAPHNGRGDLALRTLDAWRPQQDVQRRSGNLFAMQAELAKNHSSCHYRSWGAAAGCETCIKAKDSIDENDVLGDGALVLAVLAEVERVDYARAAAELVLGSDDSEGIRRSLEWLAETGMVETREHGSETKYVRNDGSLCPCRSELVALTVIERLMAP